MRRAGDARATGPRWSRRADGLHLRTPGGTLVLLEESHDLPLVDFEVTVRTGSVHDPVGREGLTRLTARMIRMGTSKVDGPTVEDTIARLGARLTVETSTSFVRFYASVIKRNVEPFVALLSKLVRRPAFRASDLAQVKRETVADIIASRDNDRSLAARHFRSFLFGDHPYGRPVVGTRASVRAIQRADVVRHYRQHFVASNMIIGAAGDLSRAELSALVSRYFPDLRAGTAPRDLVRAPRMRRGRRVLVVDKPERTQTQIFIGGLGARAKDPDLYPFVVGNTAFGGTFTARLMREVRSARGWSYGASSRIGQDRQRDAWYMWTFPGVRDAVACAELELELLDDLLRGGITRDELAFAKSYLQKSHCFDVDTAAKRLDARIDLLLYDLPVEHYTRFVPLVRSVRLGNANATLRRRLSTRDLAIVVVATAKDVRDGLARLPGVSSVDVVRFDRD